jgi:hypothetical protein
MESGLGGVLGKEERGSMPFWSDAFGFVRYAAGLKTFLREPISVEAAKTIVRHGMQSRDVAFLHKVERAVFANPTSPYLKLFHNAGRELGDVRGLLKQEGVEGTLQQLFLAGVYVTYEEFKGRKAVMRGSQTLTFRDSDFDNPLITTHFHSSSGGSRGRPTRVKIDLAHVAQSAPHWALWFAAHDWLARPLVFWTPTHSAVANRHLMCAKFGKRFVKWFSLADMGTLKGRLVSTCVHSTVRRAAGFSKPEFVPLDDAWRVGGYLVGMVGDGEKPCINTSPSAAVRTCLAMQERGISLGGVTFLLGAEPLTPARKETIEAAGAQAVPTYGFSEGGSVGSQCPNPVAADDVHISLDAYAVIQRPRSLGGWEVVDALLLTALRPACPKVLLNTEIGDYAVLETRRCGCLFDELGYFQHLHTIRSFEKVTGEGVTFLGADLLRLMEEVLPRRFGGNVGDYQLIEEQDDRGLSCYNLLVSPEVGAIDEKALVTTFLDELGRMKGSYRLMTGVWAQAKNLGVRRQHPLLTARGKVLPFRTLGTGDQKVKEAV